MKPLMILFVAVMIQFMPGCSGGDRIAGSKGGSETTNGIVARIVTDNGQPAAGSIVRVRKTDYVSNPDGDESEIADNFNDVIDEDGEFMIKGMEPGSYSVEINDTSENSDGALLLTCTIGESDTFDFGHHTLQPHARVSGNVDCSSGKDEDLVVQVRGLERFAQVEEDGSFHFDDLPAGKLDVRVVSRENDEAREISDVIVASGDTIAVQVPEISAWSRYIHIDSLIADMADTVVLTGFPFLIRLDQSIFDFSQALSAGQDIRFAKTDGTALPYDIEQWDQDGRRASVWVRIDTVFGGRADQAFVMQWGDQDAESLSDNAAVFTSDGVFRHCSETNTSIETVSGMIGSALRFDGDDDNVQFEAYNLDGDYTLSCWMKFTDLNEVQRIIWKEYSYTLWYDNVYGGIRVEHFTDSSGWRGIYQDGVDAQKITADMWYYIVGTYDGDAIHLYINGVLAGSTKIIADDLYSSTEPLLLGGRATGEFFNGVMDEVRIENARHSAEWIRLCYRNQRQ